MDGGMTPLATPAREGREQDIMTTTQTPTTYIAYWLDRTSEPEPHWIVSREDGASTTLRVCASRDEARRYAEAVALASGLTARED